MGIPLSVPVAERPVEAIVTVPGSKSLSNRALLAAAIAPGQSTLLGVSQADDTRALFDVLRRFGAEVIEVPSTEAERIAGDPSGPLVSVTGGPFRIEPTGIDGAAHCRNGGTTFRFAAALAGVLDGTSVLTCGRQLAERPMEPLLQALGELGASTDWQPTGGPDGGGRLEIRGPGFQKVPRMVAVDASLSSQFLSAVLLVGPVLPDGLGIRLPGPPVSTPYLRLTREVMWAFGTTAIGNGRAWGVPPRRFTAGEYRVEADASGATYPLAAAAVTGGRVVVRNLSLTSSQGDIRFLRHLEQMGCEVKRDPESGGVSVRGRPNHDLDADLSDIPDAAPTLAVVAALTPGIHRLRGLRVLRHKECDRLTVMAEGLGDIGVAVDVSDDGWTIVGGGPTHGARIRTYGDHRMAMAFAVVGLVVPGIVIDDAACVSKSFPGFWELWDRMATPPADPDDIFDT